MLVVTFHLSHLQQVTQVPLDECILLNEVALLVLRKFRRKLITLIQQAKAYQDKFESVMMSRPGHVRTKASHEDGTMDTMRILRKALHAVAEGPQDYGNNGNQRHNGAPRPKYVQYTS